MTLPACGLVGSAGTYLWLHLTHSAYGVSQLVLYVDIIYTCEVGKKFHGLVCCPCTLFIRTYSWLHSSLARRGSSAFLFSDFGLAFVFFNGGRSTVPATASFDSLKASLARQPAKIFQGIARKLHQFAQQLIVGHNATRFQVEIKPGLNRLGDQIQQRTYCPVLAVMRP